MEILRKVDDREVPVPPGDTRRSHDVPSKLVSSGKVVDSDTGGRYSSTVIPGDATDVVTIDSSAPWGHFISEGLDCAKTAPLQRW